MEINLHLHLDQSKDRELVLFDLESERTFHRLKRQSRRHHTMNEQNKDNAMRSVQHATGCKMKDYCFLTNNDGYRSSVVRPAIEAKNFEIKPAFISLIQNQLQFSGFPHEDTNQHIIEFLGACDLVKFNGASINHIRLHPFKFSLQSQPSVSITIWKKIKSCVPT